jgi:hypothetical protein
MERQFDAMLREQTPVEYFKELVETSLARQHVQAGDLTEFYLVNLLCQYVRLDPAVDAEHTEPLAMRLSRAMRTGGMEQRTRLRSLGDFSLFMAGFFSDSFRRRVVDVDYYVSMGEYAYGSLSRADAEDAFKDVFAELSRKFVGFSDVLADISERTALASNNDVLRLYEKWLRTGSERDGQKLIERGIVPNSSVGKRFLQ